MTINKYQGRTQEEAIRIAKEQLGENAVIMNVRPIKSKGLFHFLKDSAYEVTAAVEEQQPVAKSSGLAIQDNINFSADEEIKIPIQPQETVARRKTNRQAEVLKRESQNRLEERIENIQDLLEKKLAPAETETAKSQSKREEKTAKMTKEQEEGMKFLKMIYGIMLENEINEKYANVILEDIEKVVRGGSSVDYILSSIYQKMILKFGQPRPIEFGEKKPKVVFFIGPTGVGKTTTIAKVASKFKLDAGKKVALLSADTYRIAAAEQLKTYANILDTPFSIVYAPEELNQAIAQLADYDLILVDTAGFSHKNMEQKDDIKKLVNSLDKKYEKEVFLVVSATAKYKDLVNIADVYHDIADYKLIFTKLDETSAYGNLLNIRLYSGADLSYTTNGQNVPDDIELFHTQKIVKQLLGGK